MTSERTSDPFLALRAQENQPNDRILEQLRAELGAPKAVSGASLKKRFAISLGLLFVALLLTSIKSLVRMPETVLLSGFGISLACAAALTSGFFAQQNGATSMLSSVPFRRGVVSATAMGTLLVLALMAHRFGHVADLLSNRAGVSCFTHALLSGSLAMGLTLFAWRKSDPFSPALTGSLIGAFSGVIGVLSVGLSCPSSEGWHLMLGHGAVVAVLSLVGLAAGNKVLSP